MKNFIASVVLTLIIATPFIWMGASYIEVISQNLAPDPTYSAWNIFTMWF